jgi:DUF971 family protein
VDERRKRYRLRGAELTETELVLTWRDGEESRHSLRDLRASCPCANCRQARSGEPPAGEQLEGEIPVLSGDAATATDRASRFDLVGRYGIRITWADGHDYGIYLLENLRGDD